MESKLLEELSGILNWALEGLDRLIKQGHLTASEFVDKKVHDLKIETDCVVSFVVEECILNNSSEILVDAIYGRYQRYCQSNGLKAIAKNNFGQRLKTHYGIEKARPRVDGERRYSYEGISLHPSTNNVDLIKKIRNHRKRLGGLNGLGKSERNMH